MRTRGYLGTQVALWFRGIHGIRGFVGTQDARGFVGTQDARGLWVPRMRMEYGYPRCAWGVGTQDARGFESTQDASERGR